MKAPLLTLVLSLSAHSIHASLIAAWDFHGLQRAATPETMAATVGSGLIDLSEFNADLNERRGFGGTGLNAFDGAEPEPGTALSIEGMSANGKSIVISCSTLGYEDLVVSFAVRGTGTGFSSHSWAYSTDGVTFETVPGNNTADTSSTYVIRTVDFSSISSLENSPSVFLRLTLDGATSPSGNNRFDNLQLNASPIPEPSEWGMLFGGGLMAVFCIQTWRRRKMQAPCQQ